ncbi:MAG TPA: plastocyanin/azurin family copper-binding protein [Solirubrobacterales bacterium]|nr:plastocyanin/azurin family copper-binding protein [Solirubrobacterales bacterium]
MSAAAAKSARLGLAGAAALAVATGSLALAAPGASAESCTWKRHSRPVVKQVKRPGQLRRVRRVKHWWTCEALQQAFTPTAALPAPPTPAAPPTEEPRPQVARLGVKAVEYSYTLSRPEVDAGEVIVELNNQGEDPHNLVLEHENSADPSLEIPATPSVSQANASFTLSPGTYRLYCSLYKHEAKGMEATLVVSDG